MPAGVGEDVPTWDGDPSSFEQFVTSCRWLEASLKDTEKKLAAPKIWQRLGGSAKSVVRHLDPSEFGSTEGLWTFCGRALFNVFQTLSNGLSVGPA